LKGDDSMKILSVDEMKEADTRTIEELGIPSQLLMERAGLSVVQVMIEEIPDLFKLNVVVLCGKGNNGGDGLVVARELLRKGSRVTVVLMGEPRSEESASNLRWYRKLGGKVIAPENIEDLRDTIVEAPVLVDAVFGIGFRGNLGDEYRKLFEYVNISRAFKVAVDIPSGVNADTGEMAFAVHCDVTVTFGAPKLGHVLPPGRFACGRLKVADIGIPEEYITSSRYLITASKVQAMVPPRYPDSHKGSYGSVLVVAGSHRYSGAPLLTVLGALATGVGLVYALVPEGVNFVLTSRAPEVIALPVPGKHHNPEGLRLLDGIEHKIKAVVVGPGLGRHEETLKFIMGLFERFKDRAFIVDADALNLLAEVDIVPKLSDAVFTPHPGEFARLTGMNVSEVKNNYRVAEAYALDNGVNVLLKGPTTIITNGRESWFNITGNSALAKGGAGDVLSGLIGGFAAQGLDTLKASVVSAFLHGRCADVADVNPRTFRVSSIAEILSKVMSELNL